MNQNLVLSSEHITKEEFLKELRSLSRGSDAFRTFSTLIDELEAKADDVGYLADIATHHLISLLGFDPSADTGYLFSTLFEFGFEDDWKVNFEEKASAVYDELIAYKMMLLDKEEKKVLH